MSRRPITEPDELAHLNAQLAAGLETFVKQFEGLKKMRKHPKDTAQFPKNEFADRLDTLLAAASTAGVSNLEISRMLAARAEGYRQRHVMTAPVESAGVLPRVTRYEGNGTLVERVTAAIRGEY
jgi:hypothetical protein